MGIAGVASTHPETKDSTLTIHPKDCLNQISPTLKDYCDFLVPLQSDVMKQNGIFGFTDTDGM